MDLHILILEKRHDVCDSKNTTVVSVVLRCGCQVFQRPFLDAPVVCQVEQSCYFAKRFLWTLGKESTNKIVPSESIRKQVK